MKAFFQILDTLLYFALSMVGYYLIYEGGVIDKFKIQRTNFAEYVEKIVEIPTILTYIHGNSRAKLAYGTNFNITIEVSDHKQEKYLANGSNWLGALEFDFEALWDGSVFKITPLSFPEELDGSFSYSLSYIFDNSTDVEKVNFQLTTETGGLLDGDGEYLNMDDVVFQASLKNQLDVSISPQEHRYLKNKGCHERNSKNEIQLQKALANMMTQCENPCRYSQRNLGQKLNRIFDGLPDCDSNEGIKCFNRAMKDAKKDTINVNPCSKIQYIGMAKTSRCPSNQAKLMLTFVPPPKMKIKEEYLIYDAIAFISSVGGTLGLCVGFSFYNFGSLVLRWIQKGIEIITHKRHIKQISESGKIQSVAPIDNHQAEMLNQVQIMIRELRSEFRAEVEVLKRAPQ